MDGLAQTTSSVSYQRLSDMRWVKRLLCKHVWEASMLSRYQEFMDFRFVIRCKRCGKTKRMKGKNIEKAILLPSQNGKSRHNFFH
jgi:hypothetical protein